MQLPGFRCIAIILLACLLLLGINVLDCNADEAKIIYLKGRVKVQHPQDVFWILAKKSMVLKDEDKIKTLVGSEAEIALDSTKKNIVKLEPNTEITLQDLKNKKIHMPEGKIFSALDALDSGSSFEVRTPTAVCGVAGSGISVYTDKKKTTVSCFEHKAYTRGLNADGSPMKEILMIDMGYKRMVDRFDAPTDLVVLTARERENWANFREKLHEHLDQLRDKRAEGSRAAALEMLKLEKAHRKFKRSEDDNWDQIP